MSHFLSFAAGVVCGALGLLALFTYLTAQEDPHDAEHMRRTVGMS
jgi:hypothetical protein